MRAVLISLVFWVAACGQQDPPQSTKSEYRLDYDPKPQLLEIRAEGEERGVKLPEVPIFFVDTIGFGAGPNAVGVCLTSDGIRLMQIKKGYWEKASYYQRLYLLAHELGHCALYKEHDPDYTKHTFMNPNLYWTDYLIVYYWEEFFDDLFAPTAAHEDELVDIKEEIEE